MDDTAAPLGKPGWPWTEPLTSVPVGGPGGKALPRISLVTPNYNYGRYLESTLRSVLNQNYPNLEYIVIDDGSTDNSVDIIRRHACRLAYWEHQPNSGLYSVLNKGFSHATGDIMGWLNSDDMHCPWALQTVSSIMAALPEVEWLTTSNQFLWDTAGFCQHVRPVPGYSRDAFLDGCCLPFSPGCMGGIQQESTFWRRSLWERSGAHLSADYPICGDFELWTRFYLHAELYATPSPLGGFRVQPRQKTTHRRQVLSECWSALQEMRIRTGWKASAVRKLALKTGWYLTPGLRKLFFSTYGYTGRQVVRRKQGQGPDLAWCVRTHQFFHQPPTLGG